MFEIADLSLRYPSQAEFLWQKLRLRLKPGELLWLRGANGCGKTSLLNAISGIVPQRVAAELTGTIHLDGTDLRPLPLNVRHRHLAYQMSDPEQQLFFPRLGKEIVFALENQALPPAEMRSRLDAAGRRFGLNNWLEREPVTLSQGQKKLLLFAVCAAMQTPLLLLDEPAAGLSGAALDALGAWLREWRAAGRIVILAEHAFPFPELASQVLELGG
ncbi:MAG TPA: ABC transporter ATP-binding protein [Candidatus Syntrophosphaera sp.]|nr:ABC transporter ATP-binding protein [Candidatus Syntrophosphaera sp.]